MLKFLEVKNLQSHKDTRLDFSSTVNVLLGTSRSGKSALLRALDLVINNDPNNNRFRSRWCEDKDVTSVKIGTDDGIVVERIRGRTTENSYILNGKILTAFGQKVPEEIQDALNIGGVNIARQFDRHFLIADTQGEVAKYLNKLIDLEVIDHALYEIGKISRNENTELTYANKEVAKLEVELKQYEWVDSCEKQLLYLEEQEKVLESNTSLISSFDEYIVAISDIKEKIQNKKRILEHKGEVDLLIKKSEENDELEDKLGILNRLVGEKQELSEKKNEFVELLEHKGEVDLLIKKSEENDELSNRLDRLETFCCERKELLETRRKAMEILGFQDQVYSLIDEHNTLQTIDKTLLNYEHLISTRSKLFSDYTISKTCSEKLEKEYKDKTPDICPLCGRSG